MCFSKQNANDFIEALDEVIDEMGPEELEVKVTAWNKWKDKEIKDDWIIGMKRLRIIQDYIITFKNYTITLLNQFFNI